MKLWAAFYFLFITQAMGQVMQFSTPVEINELGDQSYSEVMISVVDEESFEATSQTMQSFLGLPSKVPSIFIHATFDNSVIKSKSLNQPLDISDFVQNSAPSLFSENHKIELPVLMVTSRLFFEF